jgi:hypothetical protein
VSQLGWTTQLPWSVGTMEQRRFDALRLLRQVPAISELAFLDGSGAEQLNVSRLAMDYAIPHRDLSQDPKFSEAVAHKVYFGPVYFRRESEPYMTLSLAGTRRESGVSVAEVGLKLVWDVLSQIKVGDKGDAYLVDAHGRLIAHPDISLVLRNTDTSKLILLQAARGATDDTPVIEGDVLGREVLTAYAPVPPIGWTDSSIGWTVFVELPVSETYGPVYFAMERLFVLLTVLTLAIFGVAWFSSRARRVSRMMAGASEAVQ